MNPRAFGYSNINHPKGGFFMQLMDDTTIIPTQQSRRERTQLLYRSGRSGAQQIINNVFGKIRNTDFEPLHYENT